MVDNNIKMCEGSCVKLDTLFTILVNDVFFTEQDIQWTDNVGIPLIMMQQFVLRVVFLVILRYLPMLWGVYQFLLKPLVFVTPRQL